MEEIVYIDTSALAKRYLPETGSQEFDQFLGERSEVSLSRLAVVELHCLIRRRQRNREFDARTARQLIDAFEEDVANGFLAVHPLEDRHAIAARDLIGRLSDVPLRSLDALHLAIAIGIGARVVATADDIFAAAATSIGLRVEKFGASRR